MKIAFVTIATNRYVSMAQKLIDSIDVHAFPSDPNVEVTTLCFTNAPREFAARPHVKTFRINHIPFPLISLMRYQYYAEQTNIFATYDYVYHIDCDMVMVDKIDEEILGDRVCVLHPGFPSLNLSPDSLPFDRTDQMAASVPYGQGKAYFQNCLQGGKAAIFGAMCIDLRERIEADLKKNYVALWHDESYMNRYMVDHPPDVILTPIYAQPQSWPSFGPTKIIHTDKNHTQIRSQL